MAREFTQEDDALLAELGVEVEAKKVVSRTPREERIIAGFEGALEASNGDDGARFTISLPLIKPV